MAHVLCVTTGLTGVLHASFELARRLEAAGHRVTYLSWSPVGDAVGAQGLPFVPLPPFVASPAPAQTPGPDRPGRLGRTAGRLASRRARLDAGVEALQLDGHARALRDLDADLALVDVEMHETVLAAHEVGLPTVLLSPWFSLWPGTGQPPLGSATVPGRDLRGHPLAVRAEWAGRRARRALRQLGWRVRGRLDRRDVLRHAARRVGFPQREWVEVPFPPPFAYRTLPTLAMALAELEFPQRRRPALHYVGPMVHADRHDVHATPEVEGRAEAVVARCREAGTRLVYAAASSMAKGDAAFLRKVAGAFARRPDWHLVVGLGGQTAPEALGALPPNATALEWAPQLRLLDAAEAAVVPGGINTIHECLHFRVPMAVYSDGLSDQDGCAARLAYHGLGVRGRKSDSETEIERTLERVLTDGGVRQSVERFHALYERSRRSGAVARLVEAHLPS